MFEKDREHVIRNSVRFKPDPGTYAFIDSRTDSQNFAAKYASLVLNESSRGCSVIYTPDQAPEVGAFLRIKVGPLSPLWAMIRWIEAIADGAYRIGLEYKK